MRRHLEVSEWLPVAPRGRHAPYAVDALRKLATLHPVRDMSAWAKACDRSDSWHWRKLRHALGLGPTEIYLAYVEGYWRTARAAGDSAQEIAASLGYADFASLGHALIRARRNAKRLADKLREPSLRPTPGEIR